MSLSCRVCMAVIRASDRLGLWITGPQSGDSDSECGPGPRLSVAEGKEGEAWPDRELRVPHHNGRGARDSSVQRLRSDEVVLGATGLPRATFFLARLEEDFHQAPRQERQQHPRPVPGPSVSARTGEGPSPFCLSSRCTLQLMVENHMQSRDCQGQHGQPHMQAGTPHTKIPYLSFSWNNSVFPALHWSLNSSVVWSASSFLKLVWQPCTMNRWLVCWHIHPLGPWSDQVGAGATNVLKLVTCGCYLQDIHPWMLHMYCLLCVLHGKGFETTIGFIYFRGSLLSKESLVTN